MLKFPSKLGLNSTWTENFQMFKLNLEKIEESERKKVKLLHHVRLFATPKTVTYHRL